MLQKNKQHGHSRCHHRELPLARECVRGMSLQINFPSMIEFHDCKHTLLQNLIEVTTDLTFQVCRYKHKDYDASNESYQLFKHFLVYTKGDIRLAMRLTTTFIQHIEIILMVFDTCRHAYEESGSTLDEIDLLQQLFRRMLLKLLYFDNQFYSVCQCFNAKTHFVPIFMCNPGDLTPTPKTRHCFNNGELVTRTSIMTEFGPLGCLREFDEDDRKHGRDHCVIVDVPRHVLSAHMLAFVMGTHERLGENSVLLHVTADVLPTILREMVRL